MSTHADGSLAAASVEDEDIVPAMLSIDGASKTYRSARGEDSVALLPVHGRIHAGEFVSLIGPSGCGKTTLLKMCAALIEPTQGTITYRDTGQPITPGRFGMVFQNAALLPWRTVLDNVIVPADVLGLSRKPAKDRARELLELVKLAGSEGKYPGELSGGMQQRVSIARALLHDPDILFMDEPFGALDALTRDELNMELQRIHAVEGKTVVFVTHSISEAALLSDRIMVFSSGPGRVVAVDEVPLSRPRGPETAMSLEFRETEAKLRRYITNSRADDSEEG